MSFSASDSRPTRDVDNETVNTASAMSMAFGLCLLIWLYSEHSVSNEYGVWTLLVFLVV